jgi:hypothetical protein
MALDPSIILQSRPAQLPTLEDTVRLRDLATRSQASDIQLAQAQRAQASSRTLSDLYRTALKPDGSVDEGAVATGMAQAGYGEAVPALQQQQRANSKASLDQQGATIDLHLKKLGIVDNALGALLAKPDVSHDDVIGVISGLVDHGFIDQSQGAQMVQQLPGPEQLRPFLVQKALETQDAAKTLEQQRPKFQQVDTGGAVQLGTTDPNSGKFTADRTVAKTPTPGEKLTDTRNRELQGVFTPDEGNLMAALAERGVALPAGMRSRAQMKATFGSLLSRHPGQSPDEIAEQVRTGKIDLATETKRATVAAGQEGKNETAVNELGIFGDQVLEASKAVPRGRFIPITKLLQMQDSALSDPALITLKSKLQTLNNAYDQLAARGGTDAEKRAHIASLFQSATGPEGVEALVKALKEEGAGAKAAAHAAATARPSGTPPAKGPGTGASETAGGATVSNW